MTACLYISPPVVPGKPERGVFPAVMADVLVTLSKPPQDAQIVTPATLSPDVPPAGNILRRKLNIIGRAAIACAGDGEMIRDFVREMEIELPEKLETLERPMRWVGDAANAFSRQRGRWIEVLGCCVTKADIVNHVMFKEQFTTERFGVCAAVGSGAEDLKARCYEFDRTYRPQRRSTAYDHALGFAQSLNAFRLVDEMGGESGGWGGYVEWARYSYAQETWVRGPKAVNLFYVARPDDSGRYRVGLTPRAIAYDPGRVHGRILSLYPDNGGMALHDFPLLGVTTPGDADIETSDVAWPAQWRPEVCTVTITTFRPDGGIATSSFRTLVGEEMRNLVWKRQGNTLAYGIRYRRLNELITRISKKLKLPFHLFPKDDRSF